MDAISKTNELFFNKTELDEAQIMPIISDALSTSDDGELFLEESHSEQLVFDDGRMKARATQQLNSPAAVSAPMAPLY